MPEKSAVRRIFSVKRLVLAGVGIVVVGVVASILRPDEIEVDTAAARMASLRVTVDAEAKARVRDRYVIAAPVSGLLQRLPVAEGDVVRGGDVVARIAPAPLDEASARQARARLDGARALERDAAARVRHAESEVAQASRDSVRASRLHTAGAIARRALEDAELAARAREDALAGARAQRAAALAEVAQASAALLHLQGGSASVLSVRAPAGGRVLRVIDRSERVVAPGTPIVELGDTGCLEVVVDVLSSDAALVRAGMPVLLDGWGGDSTVAGLVRLVEPAATTRLSALGVEEQRVNVLVDLPNPPGALGDGYRLDARIVVWSADSVLTVPTSALVRDGDGWAVFLVQSNRAERRTIRLGRMGGASAQVLQGVAPGDEVIVLPSDKVRDGVRVATPN